MFRKISWIFFPFLAAAVFIFWQFKIYIPGAGFLSRKDLHLIARIGEIQGISAELAQTQLTEAYKKAAWLAKNGIFPRSSDLVEAETHFYLATKNFVSWDSLRGKLGLSADEFQRLVIFPWWADRQAYAHFSKTLMPKYQNLAREKAKEVLTQIQSKPDQLSLVSRSWPEVQYRKAEVSQRMGICWEELGRRCFRDPAIEQEIKDWQGSFLEDMKIGEIHSEPILRRRAWVLMRLLGVTMSKVKSFHLEMAMLPIPDESEAFRQEWSRVSQFNSPF